MDIKKTLGANITRYRKRSGFTQEKLSEILEINPKHLSSIESGKKFVSAELLERLSRVLKVSASSLFYSPDDQNDFDDSAFGKIDRIIDNEVAAIKQRIRDEL